MTSRSRKDETPREDAPKERPHEVTWRRVEKKQEVENKEVKKENE